MAREIACVDPNCATCDARVHATAHAARALTQLALQCGAAVDDARVNE
jgi:hypothetical protein